MKNRLQMGGEAVLTAAALCITASLLSLEFVPETMWVGTPAVLGALGLSLALFAMWNRRRLAHAVARVPRNKIP